MKEVHDEAEKACIELKETHYLWDKEMRPRDDIVECIKLAALLHDIDDEKLFGDTEGAHPNAIHILVTHMPKSTHWKIGLIIAMIHLVPTSKNGNTIKDEAKDALWMYIPQNADRNAALGYIGIYRCYAYYVVKGAHYFTVDEPLPKTMAELEKLADPQRFAEYSSGTRHESRHQHSPTSMINYYTSVLNFWEPIFAKHCDKQINDDEIVVVGTEYSCC